MKRYWILALLLLGAIFITFVPAIPTVHAIGEDKIYYSVGSPLGIDRIFSANLDGTGAVEIFNYPDGPIIDGLSVDTTNGFLYIAVEQKGAAFNVQSIDRINVDGTGFVNLVNLGTQFPLDVAYSPSDNKVYWLEQSAPVRMRRMNPDGTMVETVRDLTNQALRELEIDPIEGYVYWSDGADSSAAFAGRIRRAPLGVGTTVELIYDNQGTNDLTGIALDRASCTLFWAFQDLGIASGLTDGSTGAPPTILGGGSVGANVRPLAIHHPSGTMYWTDITADGVLRRSNLDGSGLTDIITGNATDTVDRDLTIGNPPFPALTVPTIAVNAGVAGSGSPGTAVQYTVTGVNIQPATGVVTITAPANFEVSTNGVTFGATATLTAVGGVIAGANNVWVRIANTAPVGPVNGAITYTGGGTGNPTCSDTTPVNGTVSANTAPTQNNNTGLTVNQGDTGSVIAQGNLEFTDAEQAPGSLTYTLDTIPANGVLRLSGVALIAGNTFTQAAINAGNLTYDHDGSATITDSFQFDVSDGAGGVVNDVVFTLTITPLPPTPPPTATPLPVPGGNVGGVSVFDPAISKIGLLSPGATGILGERIQWVVTVVNNSAVIGTNVTFTDSIRSELRIDSADATKGTVNIAGQNVTVAIGDLASGETVVIRINTTVLESDILVNNIGCVASANAATECAEASIPTGDVEQLPATGETPNGSNLLLPALAMLTGVLGILAAVSARGRMNSWRFFYSLKEGN